MTDYLQRPWFLVALLHTPLFLAGLVIVIAQGVMGDFDIPGMVNIGLWIGTAMAVGAAYAGEYKEVMPRPLRARVASWSVVVQVLIIAWIGLTFWELDYMTGKNWALVGGALGLAVVAVGLLTFWLLGNGGKTILRSLKRQKH